MSKPYVRPIPWTWWNQNTAYRMFMLRELSSCFVALFVLEMLCLVASMPDGDTAARAEHVKDFIASMNSGPMIVFHVVALAFALLHSITWFNLTPKVLVLRIGEDRLPDFVVAGGHYVLWFVVSAVIWWFVI